MFFSSPYPGNIGSGTCGMCRGSGVVDRETVTSVDGRMTGCSTERVTCPHCGGFGDAGINRALREEMNRTQRN